MQHNLKYNTEYCPRKGCRLVSMLTGSVICRDYLASLFPTTCHCALCGGEQSKHAQRVAENHEQPHRSDSENSLKHRACTINFELVTCQPIGKFNWPQTALLRGVFNAAQRHTASLPDAGLRATVPLGLVALKPLQIQCWH